jgi:hypothetical protein
VKRLALALVLSSCGGAAAADENAASTDGSLPTVSVVVYPAPRFADGAARARVLVRFDGMTLGTMDLGEVGVDAESCAVTGSAMVDDGSGSVLEAAHAVACSGIHTGYRIALVPTETGVDVYTLLSTRSLAYGASRAVSTAYRRASRSPCGSPRRPS